MVKRFKWDNAVLILISSVIFMGSLGVLQMSMVAIAIYLFVERCSYCKGAKDDWTHVLICAMFLPHNVLILGKALEVYTHLCRGMIIPVLLHVLTYVILINAEEIILSLIYGFLRSLKRKRVKANVQVSRKDLQ